MRRGSGHPDFELIFMVTYEHDEEEYITLKQASERFGYSPDYIGQLIRKGKIEGKQIVANVAWVTTEEAMLEYISGNTPAPAKDVKQSTLSVMGGYLFSSTGVSVVTWTLRIALIFLVLSALLVFYFLSVAINDRLAENSERALATRMASLTPTSGVDIIPHSPMAYGE